MPVGRFDPKGIVRGDDYTMSLTFYSDAAKTSPMNLSGSTFAAQLRTSPDDTAHVDFSIDTTNAATGVLLLSLTHTQTAALGRLYAWDLQQTDGSGKVTTLIAGNAAVALDVTR